MEFVNPGFLYALSAIAIPIVIHLFNFRRFRKVYFTNVRFIRELKQQTQKQSRLRHLLVLLMRILAIAAIVLAFAQPYIPQTETIVQPEKKNAVSIYIDNSFSMQSESEVGSLLDMAKEKAKEIVSVYGSADVFQILTNDFEGKHQRLVAKEETDDLINEIDISAVVRDVSEVISRQSDQLADEKSANKTSYVISDFQKSIVSGRLTGADSLVNTYFIPIKAINTDNICIDSCWFSVPVQQAGQNVVMKVRIRNYSDNEFKQLPVKLSINGQQKALAGFDLLPRSEAIVELPFTNPGTGTYQGILEVNDYPVSFDDRLYLSYQVSSQINVMIINGGIENIFLNSLFKNDELFNLSNQSVGSFDYSSFSNFNIIILNEVKQLSSGFQQELKQFVSNGGSLLIIPSMEMEKQSFNTFLRDVEASTFGELDTADTWIGSINLDHPIYSDVFDEIPENIDLPFVRESYRLIITTRSSQQGLLEMQNGQLFLNEHPLDQGRIYLFAVPFREEYSNFVKHAIFVPTLYKIGVSSAYRENLYYTIGEENVLNIRSAGIKGDDVFSIAAKDPYYEFIPGHRRINSRYELYMHGQVKNAGNYEIKLNSEVVQGISFNYDRTESKLDFYTTDELETLVEDSQVKGLMVLETGDKPFVQMLQELSSGKQLWWWFVILALLFLALETLLLRFGK
jgi:hypothetical protein